MAKLPTLKNRFRARKRGQEAFQKIVEFVVAVVAGVVGFCASSATNIDSTIEQTLLENASAESSLNVGAVMELASVVHSIAAPLHTGISIIIGLLSAMLGLLLSQTALKFANSRSEGFISSLYTCPPETLALLEEIVGHSESFVGNLDEANSEFASLFTRIWQDKTDQYVGLIQNLSEFDVDIDSHAEVVFTKSLVDIAQQSIDAVAVDEQQFWGEDIGAAAYFQEQEEWLQANKSRRIRRLFVLEEGKAGGSEETLKSLSASKNIVDRQHELTSTENFTKLAERYEWKLLTWSDWIGVMKTREDLIVYDNKYVRRGLIVSGDKEQRKAFFRANKAEVSDAITKFEALWLIASPPPAVNATALPNALPTVNVPTPKKAVKKRAEKE